MLRSAALVAALLLAFLGADVVRAGSLTTASDTDLFNITNTTLKTVPDGVDVFSLWPASFMITGNLVMIILYAIVLAVAAKMISDGAELLLDLGLPAAIIGGVVLPLLGAVPDAVMIIFSGVGGSREEANTQIAVGMGTLAGSTIMLLTLPWLGGLILGRVDIINGEGKDKQTSKFSIKSFYKQGVTVFPDVTYGAIVMLITTIPYFIVQGADWHWGPAATATITDGSSGQPSYIRTCALVTCVLSFAFLIVYLFYQVIYSVSSKRKEQIRRQQMLKRKVIKQLFLTSRKMFKSNKKAASIQQGEEAADGEEGEKKPLITQNVQKKYAKAWQMHRATRSPDGGEAAEATDKGEEKEEENEDPKWLIFLKSSFYLVVGVVLVTVFSDPMVDVLTAITNLDNKNYIQESSGKRGQAIPIPVFYVSFVITPICSNASELVSSLIFAAKRKKINSSMTFSQLYGAATMNNTLALGVFAALVYFRDLDWQFSAEVTVILLVEFAVGIVAIVSGFGFKHTYFLFTGIFIGALYFLSILIIALLEQVAHWK